MSERKWEDLEFDCLVNILGRLDMGSLLLDVPFVCKSWFKASLSPSCWKHIDFSELYKNPTKLERFVHEYKVKKFSNSGIVKLLVRRGQGMSISLVLPDGCRDEDLEYVAEKCPELKSLSLNCDVLEVEGDCIVPKLIAKWKKLEELSVWIGFGGLFREIVAQIGTNCKNFNSLVVNGGWFDYEDALAIAKHLPKIKNLSISFCEAENLEIVVSTCKELELLDVGSCQFGGTWDEEKLKELTSHIKTFNVVPYDSVDEYNNEVYDDYSGISSDDDWNPDYIMDYYTL